VESYSTGVPNVGFALVRLNPNVADKLRTLQKRGVACVASGPAPDVALVVCVLTHETDVAYVALGPVPNVALVGCALTYETDVAYVALGPVPNIGLCCPHVPQRGRPPVLRSEQGCHATKAKAVSHVALGPVCPVESYSIGVYNVGAVHHEGHEGH